MATPRTVGLMPRHRVRPALPKVSFSWSRLPTWPTVAMQSMENLRTSPLGIFTSARSPSLLSSCAAPPAERFFGSSRAFSGSCLVIWFLSRTVINRRDAVYGLKLLSAIAASYLLTSSPLRLVVLSGARDLNVKSHQSLQILRVLNHLFAFRQFHVGFLPIAPIAFVLPAAAHLAVKIGGAHVLDFHFEDLLHRFLDLPLLP